MSMPEEKELNEEQLVLPPSPNWLNEFEELLFNNDPNACDDPCVLLFTEDPNVPADEGTDDSGEVAPLPKIPEFITLLPKLDDKPFPKLDDKLLPTPLEYFGEFIFDI